MAKSRRNPAEKRKSVSFFSGLFFIAGLCILILIGISLGKETYRKKQVQKEIEYLQSEIEKTRQENSDLSNLISYLSTRDFQEKEVREKLNLQKEDEKMVVLKKENEAPKTPGVERPDENRDFQIDTKPNWKKWLEYFFAQRSN